MIGQLSHIDVFLTNMSVGIPVPDMIADRVAPPLPVTKDTNLYRVWGYEHLTLPQSDIVAPKAPVQLVDFTFSSDKYKTDGHGLGHLISEEDMMRADDPEVLRRAGVVITKTKVELGREKAVADMVQTATNYASDMTTDLSGTACWDSTAPDIIGDVKAGKLAIRGKIGKDPDTAIIGNDVFLAMRESSAFLDRIKYGGNRATPAYVDEQVIAEVLGVKNVIVGQSYYNSAAEGQTPVLSQLWTDTFILAYVGPAANSPDLEMAQPRAWKQFNWTTPMSGAAGDGSVVRRFPVPEKRGEQVEYYRWYDAKGTMVDSSGDFIAAYRIGSVLTA